MKKFLSYKCLLRLMLICTVLPIGLLGYAISTEHLAADDSHEMNLAGSLRYRSLWIYGAQTHLPASELLRRLREMQGIREGLRGHYPTAMDATDPQWNRFQTEVRENTLDWETARRTCAVFDRFVAEVQAQTQTNNQRSAWLFGGGIVGIGLYLGLGAVFLHRTTFQDRQQRATDERFRVLFEYSSDAHLLFDKTGIVDCNDATIRMLNGGNKNQILALHPAELSPEFQPDGRASLEKCIEMDALAHRNGYHRFEWIHRKLDGETFPVEVTLTPVTLEGQETLLTVWHDLTERKRAEQKLRDSRERMTEAQSVAQLGSWTFELGSQKIEWSEEMFRIFDFPISENAPPLDALLSRYHPDYLEMHNARLQETIVCGTPFDLDIPLVRTNGEERWVHLQGRRIEAESSETGYRMMGTVQDITSRVQTEEALNRANAQMEEQLLQINEQHALLEAHQEELKRLATTDGLTGLKNHRAFQERLGEEYTRTERYTDPLSLILLDVDKFKLFNDTYGHPEGDRVLKTVAEILKREARDTDFVARYGGEEFVVILPETDAHGASEAGERFRKAIAEQIWELREVTASFGVSTASLLTENPQQLIAEADEALYAAKRDGRNRVVHHARISVSGTRIAA